MRREYDAVVVGGRVAGASTALLMARAGLDVLLVERGREGADTVSTHALVRPGVVQLARWGLLDELLRAGTPLIAENVFRYGDEWVPVAVQPDDLVPGLCAPRRTVLDRLLVREARRAGADVRHRTRFTGVLRDRDGRVAGVRLVAGREVSEVRAGLVVGADGLGSAVARAVGAGPPYRRGTSAGTAGIYAYVDGLPQHAYHWHFGRDAAVSVMPTNDGLACVATSMRPERFRREARQGVTAAWWRLLWEVSPDLAGEVAHRRIAGGHRSFPGRPAFFRAASGPGWALVGDAGHFDDPAAGHGMSAALRDAELLTRAVHRGELATYQEARDALSEELFEITDRIASFDWDLGELGALHRRLGRALRAETEAITEWTPPEAVAA